LHLTINRKNLTCEYDYESDLQDIDYHGTQTHTQPIDYPTILFLDPEILTHGPELSQANHVSVPTHILQLLGSISDIQTHAAKFFTHIHPWMPFISKKRFHELYLMTNFYSQPELILLLLAIELITSLPPRNPRTELYHAVRHFYLDIEGSGSLSIQTLQAGVLLALYELGHGIYPAAFLSIGACARYAHAMGINVARDVSARKVLTLVEVEERRRVWWAIVILDRFVLPHMQISGFMVLTVLAS
jgi:Fungal specific transcription factor domain